jgi:glycosyltransferase involved in cell wall biosynthesis
MFREKVKLSIVVPVYNEEESLEETFSRLHQLRAKLSDELDIEFIFVDDRSTDGSSAILARLARENSHVKVVTFSRNFGHQIAITAGLDHAKGDYIAIIDADLQDPPELIEDMYRLARKGYDVVYGQRRSRTGESWFKKITAATFYRIMSYMCEMEIPVDTGDFRLISRRVADAVGQLRERHRYMRGLVPWVGFTSVAMPYDRQGRFAGRTKFSLRKMLGFAINAILSFSKKPLTVATRIGLATVLMGIIGALYMLYMKLFTSIPVPGLTAILVTIVIFGGVQIFLIGIVGEYIARIFEEVKGRPLYVIEEKVNL